MYNTIPLYEDDMDFYPWLEDTTDPEQILSEFLASSGLLSLWHCNSDLLCRVR